MTRHDLMRAVDEYVAGRIQRLEDENAALRDEIASMKEQAAEELSKSYTDNANVAVTIDEVRRVVRGHDSAALARSRAHFRPKPAGVNERIARVLYSYMTGGMLHRPVSVQREADTET